uniref:ATP-sensitive inward rectifier potassium channel 1-like n=1 Tax=Monopterus albus TaxID=43700 RepID=UPI0009B46B3D|nr:ATP-sensitive inward rectifier potassium channel 1-like [Monopterus albus]
MCGFLKRKIQDCLGGRGNHETRLVSKGGNCNTEYGNIKYSKHFAFMADFWTTVTESQWRVVLLTVFASFTLSWFFFALLWYWVAHTNGDLVWQNPPADHIPCVVNVFGLTSAFLFSLETQTSLGYGLRAPNPYCPGAVTLMIIQVPFGFLLHSFLTGVIIAKISLPKRRGKTIKFSKMAVISPKNGSLCLSVRVANLRKSLMVGSQIYGKLLRMTNAPDGEAIIIDQVNIDFMVESGKDNLFFICPLTIYHVINKSSPFFEMAVDTLQNQEFELVVFLDSTAESTSSSCQVRTSFTPREIMWGYDFLPIIAKSKEGKYKVDFTNFSKVVPVSTAHCASCFYNISGHHHHSRDGYDNRGFEVIEMSEPSSVTNM